MVRITAFRATWRAALLSSVLLVAGCSQAPAPAAPTTAPAPKAAAPAAPAVAPAAPAAPASAPAAPVASAAVPAQKTPVKIGVLQSSLFTIIHEVAVKRGQYEKNGLEVTTQGYRSGQGTAGLEELLRGSTDAYIGTAAEISRVNSAAIEKDQPPPLGIIAAGVPSTTTAVVRADLPFKSVQDLKGLKMGVSSLGSQHLIFFRAYLSGQGITQDSLGLQLVALGAENMPPALLSKQIDGFLHSDPTVAIAESNGSGKVILSRKDWGEIGKSPSLALIVRREWAAKNPDVARRMIQSLEDAGKEYDTAPKAEMVKLFSEALKIEEPLMTLAIDRVDPRISPLRENADIFWKVNRASMVERGEMVEKVKVDDLFDFSFAKP
jgi:NitT/TauT family transport system substrate-binding protein